jgi:hypothetical protein
MRDETTARKRLWSHLSSRLHWRISIHYSQRFPRIAKGEKMQVKAAFIFVAPETDFNKHRAVIDSPVVSLTVVGVKNYDEAETVAKQLVAEGIVAIELCAGFGAEGTARVAKAVGDKAVVGVVRFDLHPAFNHQSGDAIFSK